jgi:hypothetical protein
MKFRSIIVTASTRLNIIIPIKLIANSINHIKQCGKQHNGLATMYIFRDLCIKVHFITDEFAQSNHHRAF